MPKKQIENEKLFDEHYIGLLEFMAEQMVNLSDSLANINKNLEKIADGEKSLIDIAKNKQVSFSYIKPICPECKGLKRVCLLCGTYPQDNEVENKGYGTAKDERKT